MPACSLRICALAKLVSINAHTQVWLQTSSVTRLIHVCGMSHSHAWHECKVGINKYTHSGMGLLRLVGSLKLYVSFAKETYKREYILQKSTTTLRRLLIVATPYDYKSFAWHNSFTYVTCLIHVCVHVCDMSHWHVWHDPFTCVTWRNHICDMTAKLVSISAHTQVWLRVSYETWHIHVCETTHSYLRHITHIHESVHTRECIMSHIYMSHCHKHEYVWHDSFTCVTWLIYMCDMMHSRVWTDSCIWVIWRIHMCDMTHLYVRHDSFIRVTWLLHIERAC